MRHIEVMPHNRVIEDVRNEGNMFGKYKSKTEYIPGVTIYTEYLKRWGDGKEMVKIWSFGGTSQNLVTDAVPIEMEKEAKRVILNQLKGNSKKYKVSMERIIEKKETIEIEIEANSEKEAEEIAAKKLIDFKEKGPDEFMFEDLHSEELVKYACVTGINPENG